MGFRWCGFSQLVPLAGIGWLIVTTGHCSTTQTLTWPQLKLARDNLETLEGEQGRKLGDLVLAGDERARQAAQAVADAKELAKPDYAAANRLLPGRTGGDPAQAAATIIDQELGL
ncbi:hypothetical protein [Pseudomonas taetrolens]|uniref:hypothetical protein n=1 Tax=Pseudomonas taetrolens TaxID=47884 RepID=UPI000B1434AE|nr:Uncharacterised protein [Pseudomonas taetrolens]